MGLMNRLHLAPSAQPPSGRESERDHWIADRHTRGTGTYRDGIVWDCRRHPRAQQGRAEVSGINGQIADSLGIYFCLGCASIAWRIYWDLASIADAIRDKRKDH